MIRHAARTLAATTVVHVLVADGPEHEMGVVVEPRGTERYAWDVWVEHTCDCWQGIRPNASCVMGYRSGEVVAL